MWLTFNEGFLSPVPMLSVLFTPGPVCKYQSPLRKLRLLGIMTRTNHFCIQREAGGLEAGGDGKDGFQADTGWLA